jgi:hypothetical protein
MVVNCVSYSVFWTVVADKLPVIPRSLLPEVWGVPQDLLSVYMNFDDNDCVVIGKK